MTHMGISSRQMQYVWGEGNTQHAVCQSGSSFLLKNSARGTEHVLPVTRKYILDSENRFPFL